MAAADGAGRRQGADWRTTAAGVLRRPSRTGPRCLVLPGRPPGVAGVALPTWTAPERVWSRETAAVGRRFREDHGLDVVVLACLALVDDEATGERHALFALELRPGAVPPPGAAWLPPDGLRRLPPLHPALRAALATWLEEAATGVTPAERNPWVQEGWFAAAADWMAAAGAAAGRPLAGPVVQIQTGSISCVLRAPTAAGDVYLKAVPPLFGAEPQIARALAAHHPRHIPPVLATDRTRRWTLLGDAGASLRRCADPAVWERVLRRHAELQRAWVGQEAALLALGCPDRRPPVLAAELDALASSLAAGRGGADAPGADVPAATVADLRAALPRLRRMCTDLAAAGPPATLVHGDLHGGNVAWREGEPVFFDWTDACLAHPFLDLATVWGDDPAARLAPHYPRLRDAYLEPWTGGTTAGRLRRAFEQALTLGTLFQAISYHRIVSSLEPAARQEWTGALPAWLRRGLARLDAPLLDPDRPVA